MPGIRALLCMFLGARHLTGISRPYKKNHFSRTQYIYYDFGRDGISGAEFLACQMSGADFLTCRFSRVFAQPSLACRPGLKAPLARIGIRPRHSEAMAAEEDFYDLDVDAEEAVTEGRSPWAVGVSSRILCKRLSAVVPELSCGGIAMTRCSIIGRRSSA